MQQLLEKHPDLKYLLNRSDLKHIKRYTITDNDGEIVECWERKNNYWIDVTEREKLKAEIAKQQEELEKLLKKEKKNE